MEAAAGRDAKDPQRVFAPDSAAKQAAATPAIRAAVQRHLAGVYARLETARKRRLKRSIRPGTCSRVERSTGPGE